MLLVREEPGGAGRELAVRALAGARHARDVSARVERLGIAAARLLQPAELEPELGSAGLDRVEQVVDRLVARRGDADGLPARDQVGDQPPRRPGLPGAGRPLDHEVPAVERAHERLHLVEVGRLDRPLERAPRRSTDSSAVYRPPPGEQRAPEPLERVLLVSVSVRPPGIRAFGNATSSSDGPA